MRTINPIDLTEVEMDIAEEIQQECHDAVDFIMKNKPGCSLQDATNVWLFAKLAKMEYRIRTMKRTIQVLNPRRDEIF